MQRTVWRHFLLVLGLLLLYDLLWRLLVGGYGFRDLGLQSLPWIIHDLPLAAGISLALIEFRRGTIRTAATVAGTVLVLMVVFDLLASPTLSQARAVAQQREHPVPARALVLSDTTGVLQRAFALMRHRVTVRDVAPDWRPRDRIPGPPGGFAPIRDPAILIHLEATDTAIASTSFFLPFIMAGLVLGIGAWAARRMTFAQPRDGRIFRVAAAWIVVFFTSQYLHDVQSVQRITVLRSPSVFPLFFPLVPAVLIAGLGWAFAARTAAEAEP